MVPNSSSCPHHLSPGRRSPRWIRPAAPPPTGPAATRRGPVILCLVACALVASLTLFLSAVPHYDPFGWLVWGLELTHSDVGFSTLTGPSWKPLPVILAVPLSVLGPAAPAAWLILARTGGALAFVFAYRLGRLLGSTAAGVLAVIALALIPGWLRELALGGELSLLVVLVLAAIDRHSAGRPGQAMGLAFAAALLRSEVWPFLGLYCIWAWRAGSVDRRLIAACCVLVPALWFIPDWLTLGDPLHGSAVARASTEARTPAMIEHPALEVMNRAYRLVPLPLHMLAAAAVGLALLRRDRRIVVLAGAVLGWTALVAVMAAVGGYPGLSRFLVPAAAVVCILGSVGAFGIVRLAGPRGRWPVAGLLLVTLAVSVGPRWEAAVEEIDSAQGWARVARELETAVQMAGGRQSVACRRPVISHTAQTQLAWILGLPFGAVRTDVDGPGLVFVLTDPTVGRPPSVSVQLPRRPVAWTDDWEVYEVAPPTAPHHACPRRFR